jgi:hypothetical protein
MSAFGRSSRSVETEDVEIAIKIFNRQMVIRRACFRTEIPDAIGKYYSRLKNISSRMARQIKAGADLDFVAKSERDFERETHAYRDNEAYIFEKAWTVFRKKHLEKYVVQKNGRAYEKYLPALQD